MKFIIAIVKPSKLNAVRDALTDIGVDGMTISDVKGFGQQKGQPERYRGAELKIDFVRKTRIEIALPNDIADAAIEAIQSAARTGDIGDGKIFVFSLEDAIRIRTGETGRLAV